MMARESILELNTHKLLLQKWLFFSKSSFENILLLLSHHHHYLPHQPGQMFFKYVKSRI